MIVQPTISEPTGRLRLRFRAHTRLIENQEIIAVILCDTDYANKRRSQTGRS